MKILILGASGTVGISIYQHLLNKYEVYSTYHRNKDFSINNELWIPYDISDLDALDKMLNVIRPNLIISSLIGDFDIQLAVHKRVAMYLLNDNLGRIIFISSANVFDGSPNKQHSEFDAPYPISKYGKFKQKCEVLLQELLGDRCLIVRIPKIISLKYKKKIIQYIKTGQPIYTNLYMSLNSAENVGRSIKFCIDKSKSGVLHLTSYNFISLVECVSQLLALEPHCYYTEQFSKESYCKHLECENTNLLRHNADGNFYITLTSVDDDIRNMPACEDILTVSKSLYFDNA